MSFINFNLDNLYLNGKSVSVFLIILVLALVFLLIYQTKTSWGFRLRKSFIIPIIKSKNTDVYKNQARILFIDDSDIPLAQSLKDDNWKVEKMRDARVDDQKLKEANIIFVDWRGVGKKISSEDEGIALVEIIKRRYKYEKYVVLYSAQEYKKPEGTIADDWISKGSDYGVYLKKIDKASFVLFC